MNDYDEDCLCECEHFYGLHIERAPHACDALDCTCEAFCYDERGTVSNWMAEDATW